METVKRTERGWAGHFICSNRCRFRRNTLLECSDTKIVVSTVGLLMVPDGTGFEKVNLDGYFETMAFHSDRADTRYHDIDVDRPVYFDSEQTVKELDADDKANDMHEAVVNEIMQRLENNHEL